MSKAIRKPIYVEAGWALLKCTNKKKRRRVRIAEFTPADRVKVGYSWWQPWVSGDCWTVIAINHG